MGLTIVALGDSRTPLKINTWTTLLSLVLNLILIPRWGFMGAAWALLAFNVFGYVLTERVLSRRLAPASRSYLVVLVALIAAYVLVGDAGVLARLAALVACVASPVAVSAALRHDLARIVAVRRGE